MAKSIEIHITVHSNWVAIEPSAVIRSVKAVAVVVETCFNIKVLCRETMPEEVGERTGLRDRVAKGVVGILRNDIAVSVKIASDVAVIVIAWNVDHVVDSQVEQPADAAGVLQCAREVLAPEIADCRYSAVRVSNTLLYKVPIVIEEGHNGFRRYLADTPRLRIVNVRKNKNAVSRHCLKTIVGIVSKGIFGIIQKVAVEVVLEGLRSLGDVDATRHGRDFVRAVGWRGERGSGASYRRAPPPSACTQRGGNGERRYVTYAHDIARSHCRVLYHIRSGEIAVRTKCNPPRKSRGAHLHPPHHVSMYNNANIERSDSFIPKCTDSSTSIYHSQHIECDYRNTIY